MFPWTVLRIWFVFKLWTEYLQWDLEFLLNWKYLENLKVTSIRGGSNYLELQCHTEESYPLQYWKENQNQFPDLDQIANQYQAIPASSAPVEHMFSIDIKS